MGLGSLTSCPVLFFHFAGVRTLHSPNTLNSAPRPDTSPPDQAAGVNMTSGGACYQLLLNSNEKISIAPFGGFHKTIS